MYTPVSKEGWYTIYRNEDIWYLRGNSHLCVAEHRCDVEAPGALNVHEEAAAQEQIYTDSRDVRARERRRRLKGVVNTRSFGTEFKNGLMYFLTGVLACASEGPL